MMATSMVAGGMSAIKVRRRFVGVDMAFITLRFLTFLD